MVTAKGVKGVKDRIEEMIDLLSNKIIEEMETFNASSALAPCPESPKSTVPKIERTLIQYIKQGNAFIPAGEVVLAPVLEACRYKIGSVNMQIAFIKSGSITDDLYIFENSKLNDVILEVKKFWTLKDNFNRLGYLHNRGILLYGPPGSGKSSVIQQVADNMVEQGDIVIFVENLSGVIAGLQALRQVEPERRVVVVFEDVDQYVGYQERDLLQLLDGEGSVDNVLYVGTTNYIDKLPARLLRPGRFDKHVFVDMPPIEGRLLYLNKKLGNVAEQSKIQEIAKKTEGFSFGALRELIIGHFCFEEALDSVLKRLKDTKYSELPERGVKALEKMLEAKKAKKQFGKDACQHCGSTQLRKNYPSGGDTQCQNCKRVW